LKSTLAFTLAILVIACFVKFFMHELPPLRPAPPVPTPTLDSKVHALRSITELKLYCNAVSQENNKVTASIVKKQEELKLLKEKLLDEENRNNQVSYIVEKKLSVLQTMKQQVDKRMIDSTVNEFEYCIARAKAAISLCIAFGCSSLATRLTAAIDKGSVTDIEEQLEDL
jgi:hypothetical protein